MRNADVATLLRIPLLILTVFAIAAGANALVVLFLLLVLFVSDALDGYLVSLGKHSLPDFLKYLLAEASGSGKAARKFPKVMPKYSAYFDIAVDRIIEYAFWLLFTLLQLLPWFVIAIVFVRNSLADALTLRKGKTFSKMHSTFGRIASSHLSRGAYGIVKVATFAYLSLIVVAGWPIMPGYALTGLTVAFSLIRGAAEIYEALI